MDLKKIIFIVGPTAVGKSDVALIVTQKVGGEIISCDSMQIYREVSIASNKPSDEILGQIPHHLLNVLSVEEEFDVARFNQLALEAIHAIHSRDKIPVIVGGSGMYMQVLLDGIFKGGVKNEALRKDLKEQVKQSGNQFLYDKLKEADPAAAKKIHPNDVRRVIRAMEIYLTEQIPISELQKEREGLWGTLDIALFALNRDRKELYRRIDTRVDRMFEEGVIGEIRQLEFLNCSKTAEKIIGVEEVRAYLRADCGLEEAKERMKKNTRHLAKRQLTWFRRDRRLEWIMMEPGDTPESIAEHIVGGCRVGHSIEKFRINS